MDRYKRHLLCQPNPAILLPEGQHRQQLLCELVNMVERWKDAGMPLATTQTRFNKKNWGNIIGGILEANGEPDFLDNADEAAAAMDDTRREFSELVGLLAQHSRGTWTAAELTDLANEHFLLRSRSDPQGFGTARYPRVQRNPPRRWKHPACRCTFRSAATGSPFPI